MSRIIGRLTSIGLGKEATKGTPVAPTFWVPVRDLDFDDQLESIDNDSGYGNIAEFQDSAIVRQWSEGDIGGKIYDQSVGLELRGVFGQAPTSVQRATSGVYDHTYEMLNSNEHATLTAAIKEANNNLRYAYGVVNSWNLEAELGDWVRRTMNLIAKKGAAATDTVAYTSENEFLPKHIVFKTAATQSGLDAASAIKARSITLEINKNADAQQELGSNDIDRVINRQLSVNISAEFYYDDLTIRNKAFNNTREAVRLEMINTDVTIGGTHNPALRFDLHEVVWKNWERNFDNNDVMTQTLEGTAVFNIANGKVITGRLTNTHTGTNY